MAIPAVTFSNTTLVIPIEKAEHRPIVSPSAAPPSSFAKSIPYIIKATEGLVTATECLKSVQTTLSHHATPHDKLNVMIQAVESSTRYLLGGKKQLEEGIKVTQIVSATPSETEQDRKYVAEAENLQKELSALENNAVLCRQSLYYAKIKVSKLADTLQNANTSNVELSAELEQARRSCTQSKKQLATLQERKNQLLAACTENQKNVLLYEMSQSIVTCVEVANAIQQLTREHLLKEKDCVIGDSAKEVLSKAIDTWKTRLESNQELLEKQIIVTLDSLRAKSLEPGRFGARTSFWSQETIKILDQMNNLVNPKNTTVPLASEMHPSKPAIEPT